MTKIYSKQRKSTIINKILLLSSISMPELTKQENIPYSALYTWKEIHIDKTKQTQE